MCASVSDGGHSGVDLERLRTAWEMHMMVAFDTRLKREKA